VVKPFVLRLSLTHIGFLRHKSEMVNFEAARALINLPDLTDAMAQNVIHVLQLFLTVRHISDSVARSSLTS
jgi:hypothetical protein